MTAFEDWKRKAQEADILSEAVARGAILKRMGREHIGPCPACAGTDRFSINVQKRVFNCRGAEGGDVVKMVMHLGGLSFKQACEELTGEPPPNGQARPLSEAEKAARAKTLADAKARERARQAREAAYQEDTREAANLIWRGGVEIAGTVADRYLISRGVGGIEDLKLRFHASLPYPKGKPYPALVARVDDVDGHLTAVWRIFLRDDGRKADVPNAKLGLGPARGGAVRLGGMSRKIGIAEGVETALGAWNLMNRAFPVWAALSTAGMVAFEPPLGVDHVVIFPDGDKPIRKRGHEYEPAIPAGRKAAEALRSNLLKAGVACTIAAEPPPGRDYLDLWREQCREDA